MEDLIKNIFINYTLKKGCRPNKNQIKMELSKILLNNHNNILIYKNNNYNLDNLDFLFIVKNGENYFKYFFDRIYLNLINYNPKIIFIYMKIILLIIPKNTKKI